jgi:predicted dehydrogenase
MSNGCFRFTRRGFLGTAAAALAAPMIIPRHVLGDENNLPANEKVALGVIGHGKMMGSDHLPHYLKMREVKVLAVCDVDTTRRSTGKSRVDAAYNNSDCAAYNDYHELLARDDIHAIACATPDHWHASIILDTCKVGKDMYCEKPLTNNLMEAKLVMDVVGKSNIIFQVGSQQRSDREFRHACELVRNGHLGKIQKVMVGVAGPPKPCNLPGEEMEPGLDWDRWLGPSPFREYSSVLSPRGMHDHFPSWRAFCEFGGGGMTDWGAHHFDIAQWGLGMDKSGPVEIVPPEDPESGVGVKYIYANGVEVIHGGPNGVTFVGEKGEIFVNRGELRSTPETIIQETIGENEVHLYVSPGGGHSGHRQDWINCVRSRKTPNCPIEIGSRTVAVCHLGNLAYLHAEELAGKSLKWDPEKWEFIGNDEANKWRTYSYPYRAGYKLPTV